MEKSTNTNNKKKLTDIRFGNALNRVTANFFVSSFPWIRLMGRRISNPETRLAKYESVWPKKNELNLK